MKRPLACSLILVVCSVGNVALAQQPAGTGPAPARPLGGPAPCPGGGLQLVGTPPDQAFLYISDANFPQVLAIQFTLPAGTTLGEVVLYGAHSPFPSTAGAEPRARLGTTTFRVLLRDDDGFGLPGAIVSDEPGITPASFLPTGVIVFGVQEIEVVLSLDPVPLPAGVYWLEIFAETLMPGEFWHWETGSPVDPNQLPTGAFAFGVPGSVWLQLAATLAVTVCEEPTIPVELLELVVE